MQIFGIILFPSCVTIQYKTEEPYYVTEYITENRTESYTETVQIVRNISHEENILPYILWSNPQLMFNDHKPLWYYGYDLSGFAAREKQKIKIEFYKQHFHEYLAVSVFDMHRRGQILSPPLISAADNISVIAVEKELITLENDISTFSTWRALANMKLNFANFLGGRADMFLNSVTASPLELDTRGSKEVAILISGPTDPRNCRFNTTLVWEEQVTENVTRKVERSIPVQVERNVLNHKTVLQSRQAPFWELFLTSKP